MELAGAFSRDFSVANCDRVEITRDQPFTPHTRSNASTRYARPDANFHCPRTSIEGSRGASNHHTPTSILRAPETPSLSRRNWPAMLRSFKAETTSIRSSIRSPDSANVVARHRHTFGRDARSHPGTGPPRVPAASCESSRLPLLR